MVYKQFVINTTLFLYNLHNGMSGTSLFDSGMLIGYSALYTFWPVLVVCSYDQSCSARTASAFPQGVVAWQ